MLLRKTLIVLNTERNFIKALKKPGSSGQKLHKEHCFTSTGVSNSGSSGVLNSANS